MSWFPEIEEASWSDTEEEVSPGVFVERRRFLTGSAAAFAFAAVGAAAVGQERPGTADASPTNQAKRQGLTYEEACEQMHALGSKLVDADSPNEDAYLYQVASILLRMEAVPTPKFGGRGKVGFARGYRKKPLSIMQIRMEPGARLKWHDHRNYNGVLFGAEGSIRCRNYDIEGETATPPRGEDFTIRETADLLLTKGRVSSLSRTRDNVHDLEAGEKGGRVLDVFTFFKGKRGGSTYMNVDEEPVDAKNRRYRARWR